MKQCWNIFSCDDNYDLTSTSDPSVELE